MMNRRTWLGATAAASVGFGWPTLASAAPPQRQPGPLKITGVRITPIVLPDPPLLAAGGCHGPYFLRNIIEIETDANITGIGETKGGAQRTAALEKAGRHLIGRNAFSYRAYAPQLLKFGPAEYAGLELACLDACGKATNQRLCELLGGAVRDNVEFAAYLFYRYAADHPKLLADRRIVDRRGRGKQALDDWGEVRTAKAMVQEAERFRKQWGFRVYKLKAGVLPVNVELETMDALQAHFQGKNPLRIDPNGRWRVQTAINAGKRLRRVNLEYYEDPVRGQEAMAQVRRATKLRMSTNSCVTRFEHIRDALKTQPIDVLLGDHHSFGGIPACQELGRLCRTVGWGMSQHSNNHDGGHDPLGDGDAAYDLRERHTLPLASGRIGYYPRRQTADPQRPHDAAESCGRRRVVGPGPVGAGGRNVSQMRYARTRRCQHHADGCAGLAADVVLREFDIVDAWDRRINNCRNSIVEHMYSNTDENSI